MTDLIPSSRSVLHRDILYECGAQFFLVSSFAPKDTLLAYVKTNVKAGRLQLVSTLTISKLSPSLSKLLKC